MPEDSDTSLADESSFQSFIDNSEVAATVSQIQLALKAKKWRQCILLDLGDMKWRPSAVSESRRDLLYVNLGEEIPAHVSKRLRRAKTQKIRVYIALTISALYRDEVLKVLADVDATVLVLDDRDVSCRYKPRHFMSAMADLQIPVSPNMRATLGQIIWSQIGSGTKMEKGQRLEAVLAFLLSQVSDLRVVERNYRTATQEIDIVLQVDNFSKRAWQQSGVPFILVEAKNTNDKSTQQIITVFNGKLQTKRQTTRIGLLFSISGFTNDAKLEELRYSRSRTCIVMLDGDAIQQLIEGDDLDEALERFVRRAMLR